MKSDSAVKTSMLWLAIKLVIGPTAGLAVTSAVRIAINLNGYY